MLERRYFVTGELEQPGWEPSFVEPEEVRPFEHAVPYHDDLSSAVRRMAEAAEEGLDPQESEHRRPGDHRWIALDGRHDPAPGLFAAPIPGRALEHRWPPGAVALFRLGAENLGPGQPAVVHHPDLVEPETGDDITFRQVEAGAHRGQPILVLKSTNPELPSISLEEPDLLQVLALPLEVLGP